MSTTYPIDFKVKTVRRYEKGESIKTPTRIYTPKEFDTISRRLRKLEHHMEIIRQTGYLSSVPIQIEELYNRAGNPFSVHELCDALDVARGTFYNHIFRKADRSKCQEEQAQLMLMVKQVFDDSDQRFGAEKI